MGLHQSMFSLPYTTTFSKIFAAIVILGNFIRGEFTIRIAGYEWIELDKVYPTWILYFSALTALSYFSIELLDSTRVSLRLRNMVTEDSCPTLSGLNTLLLATPSVYFVKRNYGLSKTQSTESVVSNLVMTAILYSLSFCMAVTQKGVSSLVIVLILCFIFLSIPFIRIPRRNSSNFVLSSFKTTLHGIMFEKLLDDCATFDIRNETFQLGLGRTGQIYRLPGGSCVDERLTDVPCPLIHPGLKDNQFLIYGNRRSIIVVEECDVVDAAWLALKISDFTGEELQINYYNIGTLSYALAVSHIAHLAMGPGPWMGVQNIEHSLIWLVIILGIGKVVNSIFAIAYSVKPLCGTGLPNTLVCQWHSTDRIWDIRSDCHGILRVEEHVG